MSSFKPRTLVMLISHGGVLGIPVPIGAVGEVQDSSKFSDVPYQDDVIVDFPKNKSISKLGYWDVPNSWLIPISNPDIDVSYKEDVDIPLEFI